jgi:hypothetical protein
MTRTGLLLVIPLLYLLVKIHLIATVLRVIHLPLRLNKALHLRQNVYRPVLVLAPHLVAVGQRQNHLSKRYGGLSNSSKWLRMLLSTRCLFPRQLASGCENR